MKDAFREEKEVLNVKDYIITLSKEYEECEYPLNRLGIVEYSSRLNGRLMSFKSNLTIEHLEYRNH